MSWFSPKNPWFALLIGGSILIVVCVVLLVYPRSEQEPIPEDVNLEVESDSSAQLASTATPVALPQSTQDFSPRNLWEEADLRLTQFLPEELGQPPTDAVLVQLVDSPRNWVVNTDVAVRIPQWNRSLEVGIKDAKVDGFGNATYTGEGLTSNKEAVHLIATVSQEQVMVYVSLDGTSYELNAFDGVGWLIPSASLGQHIDYSIPDVAKDPRHRYRNLTYLPK